MSNDPSGKGRQAMLGWLAPALADALLFLAVPLIAGGLAASIIHHDLRPQVWFGVLFALGGAAIHFRLWQRRTDAAGFLKRLAISLPLAALALVIGFWITGDRQMYPYRYDRASGLWLSVGSDAIRAGDRAEPDGAWKNAYGLRARRDAAPIAKDTLKVAMIGDSFVYGTGVKDEQTLPVRVEEGLAKRTGIECSVAVINGGQEGASYVSFPKMMRLIASHYDVDLYVILLKDDDLNPTDINTRLSRYSTNPTYRMLTYFGFEGTAHVIDLAQNVDASSQTSDAEVAAWFELIEQVSGRARVLLFTHFNHRLSEFFASHAERHPRISWMDLADNKDYEKAEVDPETHHWSASGIRRIARILTAPIAEMLTIADPTLFTGKRKKPATLRLAENAPPVIRLVSEDAKTIVVVQLENERSTRLKSYPCKDGVGYFAKVGPICLAFGENGDYRESDFPEIRRLIETYLSAAE